MRCTWSSWFMMLISFFTSSWGEGKSELVWWRLAQRERRHTSRRLYLVLCTSDLNDFSSQLQARCFLFTLVNLAKATPAKQQTVPWGTVVCRVPFQSLPGGHCAFPVICLLSEHTCKYVSVSGAALAKVRSRGHLHPPRKLRLSLVRSSTSEALPVTNLCYIKGMGKPWKILCLELYLCLSSWPKS